MPTRARLTRTLQLLANAGVPAYLSDALQQDTNGNLTAPGPQAAVLDLITETRVRASMHTPVIDTIIQVTCLARSPDAALQLLKSVRAALPFPEYDPGVTGQLGRVPASSALFGWFQRFTVHFSPIADQVGS
jgi:hypothetical protein